MAAAPSATLAVSSPTITAPTDQASSSSIAPTVPTRPATFSGPGMSSAMNPYNSIQSSYQSPYSSYSPYSRFGSSYSPFGQSSLYGGMGIGGYGSYGMNSMYGGMPGIYGGGMGMMGPGGMDPNNPSLTQALESTTQNTFALLHSIVQTFSGVAQMLESTFMATHSSFFAMVGVVDQFGQLRNALGSVLGLFGLVRWMKDMLTGRAVQGPQSGPPPPRPSKKPLIIFLLAVFGLPYAMAKLINILNERAQQQQQGQLPLGPLDPSALTFARALYPFTPSSPAELQLKENEIVAIVGKLDPNTGSEIDPRLEVETDWWRGRTRDGREGWFPRKWIEILERRKEGEAKKID